MSAGNHGRSGFSLLEAVVALTIVGLAAVAATGAFAAELRAADAARRATELEILAQEALSGLVVVPAALFRPLPDSLRQGHFESPFERYTWNRVIRPVPGTPDLFHAIITVTSPDGRSSLETRLYRPLPRGAMR